MTHVAHAAHFESHAQQEHASRLATWIFLGSEVLLFAGLFALYAAGRVGNSAAFEQGIASSSKTIGFINTLILLSSSTAVALAVEFLRQGRTRACKVALLTSLVLGVAFLTLKLSEYAGHFQHGIFPGGAGEFFRSHRTRGLPLFWSLYFVTTGLHAVHVTVGLIVLGVSARQIARGRIPPARSYVLENGALYWHLIDLIWIFLWPLYYLT
jgi:cytochrome c oxidase subunit 3